MSNDGGVLCRDEGMKQPMETQSIVPNNSHKKKSDRMAYPYSKRHFHLPLPIGRNKGNHRLVKSKNEYFRMVEAISSRTIFGVVSNKFGRLLNHQYDVITRGASHDSISLLFCLLPFLHPQQKVRWMNCISFFL